MPLLSILLEQKHINTILDDAAISRPRLNKLKAQSEPGEEGSVSKSVWHFRKPRNNRATLNLSQKAESSFQMGYFTVFQLGIGLSQTESCTFHSLSGQTRRHSHPLRERPAGGETEYGSARAEPSAAPALRGWESCQGEAEGNRAEKIAWKIWQRAQNSILYLKYLNIFCVKWADYNSKAWFVTILLLLLNYIKLSLMNQVCILHCLV